MVDQAKKSTLTGNIFHSPLTAWIVLIVSIGLTVFAYGMANRFVKGWAEDQFHFRTQEIENAIEDRLRIYEQQLWSGVGLIYAKDGVTRSEFAKFVETMDIANQWPGIQGFGYSVPVTPENKQAHIEQIRLEGFPDYTIKPLGERDMYSAIIYLEPFDWRNKRAFGYDMWSNEMRRAAMTRARDEGVAATSGIITLVQETEEDVQKGFLTYVPVYRSRNVPKTIEERQKQFSGWVYAPYRVGNLMKGILGTEDKTIEFEIFDGEEMNEENLLFDSNGSLHLNEDGHSPHYSKTVQVINQGRVWTIYFNTPKDYLSFVEVNQPRFVAIGGLIIDFLLFYVIYSIYFLQKRASAMAKEITSDLEEQSVQLIETTNSLELKVQERTQELEEVRKNLEQEVASRTKELKLRMEEVEKMNKFMVGRENKMMELKKEIKNLKEQLEKRNS